MTLADVGRISVGGSVSHRVRAPLAWGTSTISPSPGRRVRLSQCTSADRGSLERRSAVMRLKTRLMSSAMNKLLSSACVYAVGKDATGSGLSDAHPSEKMTPLQTQRRKRGEGVISLDCSIAGSEQRGPATQRSPAEKVAEYNALWNIDRTGRGEAGGRGA